MDPRAGFSPRITLCPTTWPQSFKLELDYTLNPDWVNRIVDLLQVRAHHQQGIVILTTFQCIATSLGPPPTTSETRRSADRWGPRSQ